MPSEDSGISQLTYDQLVALFRLHPTNLSEVARLAGVSDSTARTAWDGGFHGPSRPWAIPIRAILEMDYRDGVAAAAPSPEFKALIPKKRGPGRPRKEEYTLGQIPPPQIPLMTVRKLALLAEAEAIQKAEKREEIRQAHIQQIAQEKRVIMAAREDVLAALEVAASLTPAFKLLAATVADKILKDPLLTTREAMEMMGKWVSMIDKSARAADVVISLMRLDRGASTQNVEVHHHAGDEMSYEEAMETMSEAVEEAKQLGVTSDETIEVMEPQRPSES